MLRIKTM